MSSRRRTVIFSVLVLAVIIGGCNRTPGEYVERGNQFFKRGKYKDASILYRKAIQQNPKFGEAYYRLGVLQIEQGNLPDAYQALMSAVALMPNSDEAKIRLADVSLAGYRLDDILTPEEGRVEVLHDRVA